MRRTMSALLFVVMALGLLLSISGAAEEAEAPGETAEQLFSGADAAGALRGYSEEEGYVYVTFGRYPQSIDGGVPEEDQNTWKWQNAARTAKKKKRQDFDPEAIEKEPILWRVLSADEDKAYLLSEYILFAAPMHGSIKEFRAFEGEFTKTDLWQTLNGSFAEEAFTEAEYAVLLDNDGLGKVFLPSSEETSDLALGFAKDVRKRVKVRENDGTVTNNVHSLNESRKAWATEYAIRATGAYVYPVSQGSHSPYWMRDPVLSKEAGWQGRNTKNFGYIGRYACTNPEEGARPGVLLDPKQVRIESGSGTRTDPYVIVPAGE